MNAGPTTSLAASPLPAAVDQVRVAVQHLTKLVDDGALTDLGAVSLVEFLQGWEQVRNTMPVIDRAAIQFGIENEVPKTLSERSMTQVLTGGLRLSAVEALRRVKAAEHLAERHSVLGEPLPPLRPHLAAAQRAGTITCEQVSIIDTALRGVDRCDPAKVDDGEQLLTEAAAQVGADDLRLLVARVVDAIDPDGVLPDEAEQQRKRHLNLRQRPDGSWVGEFRLTPTLGRKLADLIGPLTKPGTTSHDTDRKNTFVEDDDRSLGQRRHDALESVLDRLLRRDDNPDTGGTPTMLIISMSYHDYITKRGTAQLADGTPISVATALGMAEQADLAFVLTDTRGAVLDLHRSRRIASKDQTLALYARDKGCSFPGCAVEAGWCERHHVISWWDGGDTDINNLTLLCPFHHHQFQQRGWQCQMRHGLPYWIPPKWIDSEQKPILHHRITIANWDTQQPLDL